MGTRKFLGALIALVGMITIGLAARNIVTSFADIFKGSLLPNNTDSIFASVTAFSPLTYAFIGGLVFVAGCVVMTPMKPVDSKKIK